MTADEYEDPPRVSLDLFADIRRCLSIVGAIVISAGTVLLIGYGLGRRSVLPKPGEEARLDSVKAVLGARSDSLEGVIAWERAQRAILEQKHAAGPQVDVIGPGKVRIRYPDPSLEPRMVDVAPELTATLSLARQINASLRVELDAEHQRAETEKARADSAERTTQLARAVRSPWLTAALQAGYDWGVQAPMLGAAAGLRVSDRLSVHADASVALEQRPELRSRVYGQWQFFRWP